MRWRNLVKVSSGALALSFGLTFSGSHPVVATTQPGTLSCTRVSGTVKFNPPLTDTGSASEIASFALLVKGCAASAGATSPKVGHGSSALSLASNSCADLTSGSSSNFAIAISWRPTKDDSTEVTFAGYSLSSTASLGLSLGGPNTTASGSFTGSDSGASSTALLITRSSASEIGAACATKKGLRLLKIGTGTLNLQ